MQNLSDRLLYLRKVSCGRATTCGIRMNGSVNCWGKNQSGQTTPPRNKFKQISVGFEKHSCGITMEGDIKCWGSNSHGQGKFSDGPFIQVSSGMKSTCAIHANHTVECWGQQPHYIPSRTTSNSTKYQQITLGMEHICAINEDRKVQCWHSGPDIGAHLVPLGFFSAKK